MIQANAFILSFPVDFKLSRFRIIYSNHIVVQLAINSFTGSGSGVLYRSTIWKAYHLWHTAARRRLENTSLDDLLENKMPALDPLICAEPGLAFAIDTAVLDLKGKVTGNTAASMLGEVQRTSIPITEQIFIDNWRGSRKELARILDRGTKRLKIKTGFSPAKDIALIKKIRQFVGKDIEIGIDANRAYSLAQSIDLYCQMQDLGVTVLEEPINDPDLSALHRLRETVKIPVMLDESVLSPDDLQKAIQSQALDSLNIKLTRVGGMTAAQTYQRLCEDASITVSIGCNEDIGPGMASLLHFSAVQDQYAGTEGIGNLRLGTDIIQEPMVIRNGTLALPSGPGLGVTLKDGLPRALPGSVRFVDFRKSSPAYVRPLSFYLRNRQRAATAVYRLQRKFNRNNHG